MGTRRQARQLALEVLYQLDLRGIDYREEAMQQLADPEIPGKSRAYAQALVDGVSGSLEDLDRRISQAADNWRLERLAVVDRVVLRIGTYEMFHSTDVPPKVAINEAIEIAKQYSTAESGYFVNGVLDRIRRLAGLAVDTNDAQEQG